jgi:hypothetical protein
VDGATEAQARSSLRRSTIIYCLILAADALIVAYIVSIDVTGAIWIWLALAGGVGLLLAQYAWQHIADLKAPLVETEGEITRKWKHAELLIAWQSYYIKVGRRIFRLSPIDYELHRAEMWVRVVHFPRTLTVVSVQQIQAPPAAESTPPEAAR